MNKYEILGVVGEGQYIFSTLLIIVIHCFVGRSNKIVA